MNSEGPLFLALALSSDHLSISLASHHALIVEQESVSLQTVESDLLSSWPNCPAHVVYLRALDVALENLRSRKAPFQNVCAIGGSTEFQLLLCSDREVENLQHLNAKFGLTSFVSGGERPWKGVVNPMSITSPDTPPPPKKLSARSRDGVDAPHYVVEPLRQCWQRDSEAIKRIASVTFLPTFMASIFCTRIVPVDENVAAMSDLWDANKETWSEEMIDAIVQPLQQQQNSESTSNTSNAVHRSRYESFRSILGEVHRRGDETPVGHVGRYFVERYNFHPDCVVCSFSVNVLELYKSCCIEPGDALITFDYGTPNIAMMKIDCGSNNSSGTDKIPVNHIVKGSLSSSAAENFGKLANNVNPSSSSSSQLNSASSTTRSSPIPQQNLAYTNQQTQNTHTILFSKRDAATVRNHVKDTFCNASWSTFDQLVAQTPQGGSFKVDDKMFVINKSDHIIGKAPVLCRFEKGHKVPELSDRRAIARCVLDSQFLGIRVQISRTLKKLQDVGYYVKKDTHKINPRLEFHPFTNELLPKRIIAVGPTAQRDVIVQVLANVFGAPVYRTTLNNSTLGSGVSNEDNSDAIAQLIPTQGALARAIYCWYYLLGRPLPSSATSDIFPRFAFGSSPSSSTASSNMGTGHTTPSSSAPVAPSQDTTPVAANQNSSTTPLSIIPPSNNASNNASLPLPHSFKLTKAADPDNDEFVQYGSMVEEFVRLDKVSRLE